MARLSRRSVALWDKLTEPAPAIQNKDQRRQTRLASTLLLAALVSFPVSAVLHYAVQDVFGYQLALVMTVCTAASYWISRTRRYRLAILFMILLMTLVILLYTGIRRDPIVFSGLIILIFLYAQLFDWRQTLALAICTQLGIVAITILLPGFLPTQAVLLIISYFFTGILAVAAAYHRQHDQQAFQTQTRQLEDSAARYRALFEQATDAIFLLTLEEQIIAVNQRAADLLGCDVDDLLRLSIDDLIPPEERASNREVQTALLAGEIAPYERTFVRADGQRIPVEVNAAAIRNRHGQPVAIQSIVRDIRIRKQAEAAQRESDEKFRAIFDESLDVIIVLGGANRQILSVNQAAKRVLGYEPQALIGQPLQALFPAEAEEDTLEMQFHGVVLEKQSILRADGSECLMDITVTLIPWRQGKAVMLTLRDVSQRSVFERQRLELAAERTQVEALRRFISDTSHDLRTPLSVMNTSLYLIRRRLPAEELAKIERQMQLLEAQTAHMAQILQDFADMTELDFEGVAFHFQRVNLHTLIHHLVAQNQPAAALKLHNLTFFSDDPHIYVHADARYLTRAVQHLLTNAINYTPNGGQIAVSLRRLGSQVELVVRDNGIGIAPQELPHVFERFYRADNTRPIDKGGTGLGLTIARKIVEQHEGTITLESAVGAGTLCCVWLPAAEGNLQPEAAEPRG